MGIVPRSRSKRIVLISLVVIVFLAISGLLARFLSTENVERDDILEVLQAQAAGHPNIALERLADCPPRSKCAATVRANAIKLRRKGSVKILELTSATAYSLSGATGATRVAWTVIGHPPIVQCVRVKRTGNFLAGMSVELLSLSAPISNEADC